MYKHDDQDDLPPISVDEPFGSRLFRSLLYRTVYSKV